MDQLSHNLDIEARDPDKLRDQALGAGTSLAASFGAELGAASGSAESPCPGGLVAAQPPVRGQGPHASGERPRLAIILEANIADAAAGGRVTPPASDQSASDVGDARAISVGSCSVPISAPSSHTGVLACPSPETTTASASIVGRRVDALVIAFAISVSPAMRDEILERQSIADLAGRAQLVISNLAFAMKKNSQRDTIRFENADLRGSFNERSAGGWQLEIIVRAVYLATHCLEVVIALTKRIAEGFGAVVAARLRRFDLAVDVVGFLLANDDVDRIMTRARIDAFIAQSKDVDEVGGEFCKPAMREHFKANHAITGFSVAQGNPLMARIYDKTAELAQPGRDEKRAVEFDIWRANGWNGTDQVTRVEFQHRGQFLDEIGQRDIDNLNDNIDAVWQLDVQWLRFVDPGSAKRLTRCALDPRWAFVTGVVFVHTAHAIARNRVRGGATAVHVLGAALSYQAACGHLVRIELGITDDGELLDERTFAHRMTPDQAVAWLDRQLATTFDAAAHDIGKALRTIGDPRDAVARYIAKHNSAVARFSSADDELPDPASREVGNDKRAPVSINQGNPEDTFAIHSYATRKESPGQTAARRRLPSSPE